MNFDNYTTIVNNCNLRIKKLNTIYIGYDPREHLAVNVLIDSIIRLSSKTINIITLNLNNLRHAGLYRRTCDINSTCWGTNQDGIMRDSIDTKPFSTEFSFSRFLTPILNQNEGWALFMDCDMYFRSDPCEIFEKYTDKDKAVLVVKHNKIVKEETKMYGCPQTSYSRKNWSSLVLFNCSHPSNKNLTVDDVNTKSGNWLHNFRWLDDNEIGDLPEEWNWLDSSSNPEIDAKNVHFTTGGPWFKNWTPKRDIDKKYANEWSNLAENIYIKE